MATSAFSFDGAVQEAAPFIPFEAFNQLSAGSLLNGKVESLSTYQGVVTANVLINGHVTGVKLWDRTLDQAKEMIGQPITVRYMGPNPKNTQYPLLNIQWR